MPYVMVQPINIELVDRGAQLEIRLGAFDVVRRIHMTNAATPGGREPSPLGYSIGSWQDGALVIETAGISAPFASVIGLSQTAAMRVTERFSLQEEQAVLAYEMTLSDPETFERPAVYRSYYVALGEELEQYECRGD